MFGTPTKPRTAAKFAVLLALPFLVGSLAACSTDGADSTPTKKPSSSEQTLEDWQLDFASCMRGEGLDYPDPGSDSVISIDAEHAEAFQDASKACTEKLGPPPGGVQEQSPQDAQQQQEDALKSAQCLRDRGFDVPDPKPNEGLGLPADVTNEDIAACVAGFGKTGQAPSITHAG